jgi:transketolase
MFERAMAGELPAGFDARLAAYKKQVAEKGASVATRVASGDALAAINDLVPETIGGSADLTGSVNTRTASHKPLTKAFYGGRYVHWGVREHGMAAAMNGMALHGGVIPYGGTFLVFADYCRPAIRLSALMGQRVVYVMTHDSIGLGEDGPTHQPVEHLAALRAMPNLNVFRPADAVETVECWQAALRCRATPSVLALTRQNLPTLRTAHTDENLAARGAYELLPADGAARATILATGSEVAIAAHARKLLAEKGVAVRVVSMPCWELFAAQPEGYRRSVLGALPRVGVEAAVEFGWERWLGADGGFVGMTGFGASAPYAELYKHFGITAETVAEAVLKRI